LLLLWSQNLKLLSLPAVESVFAVLGCLRDCELWPCREAMME
jgi:hypothetical protein